MRMTHSGLPSADNAQPRQGLGPYLDRLGVAAAGENARRRRFRSPRRRLRAEAFAHDEAAQRPYCGKGRERCAAGEVSRREMGDQGPVEAVDRRRFSSAMSGASSALVGA